MAERFDSTLIQIRPEEDLGKYQVRVNEAFRRLSKILNRLEGRGTTSTLQGSLKIKSENYSLLDFEGQFLGKGSIGATSGIPRTFFLAKGAQRDSNDGQWVATDTGCVILEMKDDGTMVMYSNTGLVIGAAFSPTVAITFPTGSAPHGLVSATHTASGLTAGYVLQATGTNTFSFQPPSIPKGAKSIASAASATGTVTWSTAIFTDSSGIISISGTKADIASTGVYWVGVGLGLTVPASQAAQVWLNRFNSTNTLQEQHLYSFINIDTTTRGVPAVVSVGMQVAVDHEYLTVTFNTGGSVVISTDTTRNHLSVFKLF